MSSATGPIVPASGRAPHTAYPTRFPRDDARHTVARARSEGAPFTLPLPRYWSVGGSTCPHEECREIPTRPRLRSMKSPRRRSVLGLLGVSAAVAIALPIYTMAIGASPQPPDLRADPVENIDQPAIAASGLGAGRLLVRFDGFVTNVGEGPLEVSGDPQLLAQQPPGDAPAGAHVVGSGPERDRGQRPGEVRGGRRPQALPPDARHAVLAVEQHQDGRGGPGPEGRLLPLRPPAGERRADRGPADVHRGRHPLLP